MYDPVPESLSQAVYLPLDAARVDDYVGRFPSHPHNYPSERLPNPPAVGPTVETGASCLQGSPIKLD